MYLNKKISLHYLNDRINHTINIDKGIKMKKIFTILRSCT